MTRRGKDRFNQIAFDSSDGFPENINSARNALIVQIVKCVRINLLFTLAHEL